MLFKVELSLMLEELIDSFIIFLVVESFASLPLLLDVSIFESIDASALIF